ncbi:MAG: class I SAM-dependent methyltransferase [Polyangiaceae bacterium]
MRRARRVDHELIAGSAAHYEDAAYYSSTYEKRREDVAMYASLAEAHRGDVLEYGCGNGRITIPIAKVLTGSRQIVGVDLSRTMLADLRVRLGREDDRVSGRVAAKRGDMRRVRLNRRFGLVICPFNALLHLYTRVDVEQFLARVREHLAPRARFVFDVSMPVAEELARKPERAYFTPRFKYPGVGLVRYSERFDYEPLRQVLFVSMRFEPQSGAPFMTPLAHRQFFPQELEALLHYNGFEVLSIQGDFDGPATNESRTLVYTTRARPSAIRGSGRSPRPSRSG